ncbi:MAG: ATP-binding protein [Chloroflexota bacterium]
MESAERIELVIPSQLKYLTVVGACVAELCQHIEGLEDAEQMAYNVQLAVHEGVANVIQHAYDNQPGFQVTLVFTLKPFSFEIEIRDQGKGFDLAATIDQEMTQAERLESAMGEGDFSLELMGERQRGLLLMTQLMDEVSYQRDKEQGNRLCLVKRWA